LVDTIAHYISELILNGELPPGARVNEAEMAERFGVSRGPVREAIAILSSGFIVDVYPRRGAFVADMDGETVKQLCEYAAYQFANLVRELQRSIHSPSQLDVFDPLIAKLTELAADPDTSVKKFQDACLAVETQACDMIQNRFLLEALSQMGLAVRRVEALAFEQRNAIELHAAFITKTLAVLRETPFDEDIDRHFRSHYEEMWKQLVRQGKIS
jgi:DNA-binding GntR family transcriptional regulator